MLRPVICLALLKLTRIQLVLRQVSFSLVGCRPLRLLGWILGKSHALKAESPMPDGLNMKPWYMLVALH